MDTYFGSEFFSANRRRLRELFTGTAPIVMSANGLLQRGADSTYAFAQEANFWYLTGIDEPDIILVMDRDKEYLIVPARSASREAFDGSVDAAALTRRSGVQTVYDDAAGWELLGSRLKKVKHVAIMAVPPAYVEQYGMYTNPARAVLQARLKEHNPAIELLDLYAHLIRMRAVKQPQELAAIKQAIKVTTQSIKQATGAKKLHAYTHEYQLEAELTRAFRRSGSEGHAFEPIVASGERACVLHNVANNGQLASDELVLLDVGAQIEHYAADISRTFSLSSPSRRQETVHAAVLAVQDYAFSLLGPGVNLREYEQKIEHYMGKKLRELGLIKTIDHDAVRQFYPHATSHFLGLNVHDVGDYERPLEPGMVLTVEPGIYIPNEGIGIRIEDDVLVTDKGIEVLSKALSRDLA